MVVMLATLSSNFAIAVNAQGQSADQVVLGGLQLSLSRATNGHKLGDPRLAPRTACAAWWVGFAGPQ
jgi:hypothetical protein